MLHLVYFSNITENTHRFVENLGWEKTFRIPLQFSGNPEPYSHPYVLICPSYGTQRNNHIPPQVKKFIHHPTTSSNCVGVVGTGNMNFGEEYAISGPILSEKLQVPLLYMFELAGTSHDIEVIRNILQTQGQTLTQKRNLPTFVM